MAFVLTAMVVASAILHLILFYFGRRREYRNDCREMARVIYNVPWLLLTEPQRNTIERRLSVLGERDDHRTGEAIIERMNALGLTVAQLAARTGIAERTIRDLRQGKRVIDGRIAGLLPRALGENKHYWLSLHQPDARS